MGSLQLVEINDLQWHLHITTERQRTPGNVGGLPQPMPEPPGLLDPISNRIQPGVVVAAAGQAGDISECVERLL